MRVRRNRSWFGLVGVLGAVVLAASGCLAVGTPTKLTDASYVYDVNASGVLVGGSLIPSPLGYLAFSYDPSTGTKVWLGGLGGTTSYAYGINDAGTIVGVAALASGQSRAFRYTSGTGMTSIGVLSPPATTPWSSAADVNAAGTIVGQSNLETGANDATHAFAYDPSTSTMADLGTLGGTSSAATAINDAGVIVGWSDIAGDTARHAFAYDPSTKVMSDLGAFGGTGSVAEDINDLGQVVGSFDTGEDAPDCAGSFSCPLSKGFVYDLGSDSLTVLPLATGFNSATAAGINDDGVIVGTATEVGIHCSHCSDPSQATAWELGTTGVYALDPGQSYGAAINDGGRAVGTSITFSGGSFPIPVPYGFYAQVDKASGA